MIDNYEVTTTSGEIVGANPTRRYLVLTNTGAKTAFLNIGGTAEVNKGIVLMANGGTWLMDRYSFSNAAIEGIVSDDTTNIAIYEE